MINNNNIIKNIFIIAIILSVILSFNSYANSSQYLDDFSYVMAIGVDVGENSKYKISLQLTTMESSATDAALKSSEESSGSSSSSSSFTVHTMETDSIDSAINVTNAYVNKTINLSHCKVLVISEEVAKKGIEDIVNSVINKVEIRPDCNILISKVPDNEFSDDKTPELSEILEKYYDIASNIDSGRGFSESVKLSDFYFYLNDTFTEAYSTLGITSNTKKDTNNSNQGSSLDSQAKSLTNKSEKNGVEIIGLSVFKGDKLVGTLSANQTMAHQLIKNELDYCTLNIPSPFSPNETLDLYVSILKKPRIKVDIYNGSPFVDINLYLTVRLLSFNSDTIDSINEDSINTIKIHSSSYIRDQIYDYLNKTSKELNSDIAGIGKYAAKNFSTLQDLQSYNWLENYRNCAFKVNVDVSIKSGHLLSNE